MRFSWHPEIRRLRKQVGKLEGQLEQERTRHLAREDQLVDRILTGAKRFGLQTGTVDPPKPEMEISSGDPQEAVKEAETRAYYRQCAIDQGLPAEQGDVWYDAEQKGEKLPYQVVMESEQ